MMKLKRILAAGAAALLALSLAACQGGKKIESADDLTDAVIGAQSGTTGALFIDWDIQDGLLGDASLQEFKSGMEAVTALKQGKIDAVVIDNEPAKIFVEQNDGLKILDAPYITEEYAMAIAKENTELKEAFNAAIAELKADGTLDGLMDYYINKTEGSAPYTSPEGIVYDGQLTMATNAEFPPYEYHENNTIIGLDVDLARAICDKLGKELVISDMAFDTVVTAVQTGKADFAAAGLTVTEERLLEVDFTDSYTTAVQVIIVKE